MLVSPTVPLTAPLLGRAGMADPLARPRTDWWTVEANLAAIPAASVPVGLGGGLPVGVQLMTAHGEDARIYRVGAALEAALVRLTAAARSRSARARVGPGVDPDAPSAGPA